MARWRRLGQRRLRRRCGPHDRHDKAIAAPRDRLDAAGRRASRVENPAKSGDLHVETVIFDDTLRPRRGNDLVSHDEIARPLDQHTENIERPRADRHRDKDASLVALEQAAAATVEPEAIEQKDVAALG